MDYKFEFDKLDNESKIVIESIFDVIDEEIDKSLDELKSDNLEEAWGESFYYIIEHELSFINSSILHKFKFDLGDFFFDYFIKKVESGTNMSIKKTSQLIPKELLSEIELFCIQRVVFYKKNLEKDNMLDTFCKNPYTYPGLMESYFKDLLVEIKKEFHTKKRSENLKPNEYKKFVKKIFLREFSFPKSITDIK